MTNSEKVTKSIRASAQANQKRFYTSLNILTDYLFELAEKKQWSWEDWAVRSGVHPQTIRKLGTRETKSPQLRTLQFLAYPLGKGLELVGGNQKTPQVKPTWKVVNFTKTYRKKYGLKVAKPKRKVG